MQNSTGSKLLKRDLFPASHRLLHQNLEVPKTKGRRNYNEETIVGFTGHYVDSISCSDLRSAFACGSLIAPDGDVRLARAATLIAWHDGIEHYMTTFAYSGSEKSVGWLTPLPAVPLKIEDGGAWTFQRLQNKRFRQERFLAGVQNTAASNSATVLEQVKIEALNVTVIKGSGDEIINWATQNGFFLDEDTRAHLLIYAHGSPIFMAAKYDTQAAQAKGQLVGDGVPRYRLR